MILHVVVFPNKKNYLISNCIAWNKNVLKWIAGKIKPWIHSSVGLALENYSHSTQSTSSKRPTPDAAYNGPNK